VGIQAIDHLYIETRSFERAVAFWEGLGFEFAERWGSDGHRAGRLKAGNAEIVLAEGDSPVVTVHFRVADAGGVADQISRSEAVRVRGSLARTHWGTRLMRVEDTDGHVFALEETPP
jgi:catechol 2,3-dioxygenase-like lactoylglutathione lyase family enzyme